VRDLARRAGLTLPICEEVYRVTHEGKPPAESVRSLMTRDLRPETERTS
jgi:glycerol-3-phosphate dehydrogenase (NAD(P)+)